MALKFLSLTQGRRIILQLNKYPPTKELSWEVEEVSIVKKDEKFDEFPRHFLVHDGITCHKTAGRWELRAETIQGVPPRLRTCY